MLLPLACTEVAALKQGITIITTRSNEQHAKQTKARCSQPRKFEGNRCYIVNQPSMAVRTTVTETSRQTYNSVTTTPTYWLLARAPQCSWCRCMAFPGPYHAAPPLRHNLVHIKPLPAGHCADDGMVIGSQAPIWQHYVQQLLPLLLLLQRWYVAISSRVYYHAHHKVTMQRAGGLAGTHAKLGTGPMQVGWALHAQRIV